MKYIVTVQINDAIDVNSALAHVAQFSGIVRENKDGLQVIFTVEGSSINKAFHRARDVCAQIGSLYSILIVQESSADELLGVDDIPPLVSASQAAEILGVSTQAINKRLKSGTLPGLKVGSTWVIPLRSVKPV